LIRARIIALIAQVYGVEAGVRGTSADQRYAARHAESVEIMAQIKSVLDATLRDRHRHPRAQRSFPTATLAHRSRSSRYSRYTFLRFMPLPSRQSKTANRR
jgi:hypothetical protein